MGMRRFHSAKFRECVASRRIANHANEIPDEPAFSNSAETGKKRSFEFVPARVRANGN
jgi:hypothetical protein